MPEPDDTFLVETLKKIQVGIVELRNAMTDLRTDMRDLKESQLSTREEIQALRRDVLRQERGFASLQIDMDTMKSRLDDRDHPSS